MNDTSGSGNDDRPLVGREEELAVLQRAVDAVRTGRGHLVVVEGPPGSGKTRLVEEAASVARRQGWRVLSLPAAADRASTLVREALDDAARGRAVVIVDDRREIAGVRATPVTSIAGDLSELPVLALVTRTEAPGRSERPGRDDAPDWHAMRLRVRPLRAGAVIALAARMGVATSIPILERLHTATGGNALLVVETLTALSHVDAAPEMELWPLTERTLLWMSEQLEALGPRDRDTIEAASVLGEECDVALLARTTAADAMQVRAALAASGFTMSPNGDNRCRFVPSLARDLVYASLSADRRAALHGRAASVLAASGSSAAVLAHRSLAASAAGDPRRCQYYVHRLVRDHASSDVPLGPSCWPYFVREGEHWAIGFGDRSIRVNDRAGLLYLAHLLSRPGVEFAALALGEWNDRRPRPRTAARDPTLAAERARVRVTRRIRDGIERIARVHPDLGMHLARTIRTGVRCAYAVAPTNAPRWEVRVAAQRSAAYVAGGPAIPTRRPQPGKVSTPAKSVT